MKLHSTLFVQDKQLLSHALNASLNTNLAPKQTDLAIRLEGVLAVPNSHQIELTQVTNQHDVTATVETALIPELGEQISGGKLPKLAANSHPHRLMSCCSSFRRGSLMAAWGITPEEDHD